MLNIVYIIILVLQLSALCWTLYTLIKCHIEGREYAYFITYFHKNGNGCAGIVRNRKIDSWDEIQNVRKFIEEENHLENVVIINYRRLKK